MELSAAQRERYERNLLVEGFTDRMQQALIAARVAVVGAGGLGSAALNYLVAAGVGHLTLIENDTVSLSNLQRQVLYTTADMGRPKAEVAAMRLSRLNPGCDIRVVTDRLTAANAAGLLGGHDAVVDCTDNYDARYVIDDFCREAEVPMIYGTAEAVGGQVAVFHAGGAGGYRDLYPERASQKPVVGVLSPIVGVIVRCRRSKRSNCCAEWANHWPGICWSWMAGRCRSVNWNCDEYGRYQIPDSG